MRAGRSFRVLAVSVVLVGTALAWQWQRSSVEPTAQANPACPPGSLSQLDAEGRSLSYATYDGFTSASVVISDLVTLAELDSLYSQTIQGSPQPQCVWYVKMSGSKTIHRALAPTPTPTPAIENTAVELVLVFDSVTADSRIIQYSTAPVVTPSPLGSPPPIPALPSRAPWLETPTPPSS